MADLPGQAAHSESERGPLLRHNPAFRRLQVAGGVDGIGDGAFAAAVPLLAITVTRDPRLVSVVSAAALLPWLLFSLPVGALVDRRDRIALMWQSQVLQAVAVSGIAVLAATGRVGVVDLGALALVIGIGEVIFGNASQAVLPDLVPRESLHRANGAQYAVQTVCGLFVGPPLGSLLFGLAVALPFGLDAASFAISAALLATLPRRRAPVPPVVPLRRSIAEGLRFLLGDRLLRTLAILLGVNNFCGQFGASTLALFATETLGVSQRGYGILLVGTAVGAVIGGLCNARVVERIGEAAALLFELGAMGVVYLAMGLAPNAVTLGLCMALNGFLITLWNIVTVSLRQELVPNQLLGRVNSAYRMLGWGMMPLGALVGGLVAFHWGLRAPYLAASGIRLAVGITATPALMSAMRALRR